MSWAEVERNLLLYFDDGRIEGRYPDWVQDTLMDTLDMFCRFGMEMNLEKTKTMVCTPGFIWGQVRNEAYKLRAMGEGETFWEIKRTRGSCSE